MHKNKQTLIIASIIIVLIVILWNILSNIARGECLNDFQCMKERMDSMREEVVKEALYHGFSINTNK